MTQVHYSLHRHTAQHIPRQGRELTSAWLAQEQGECLRLCRCHQPDARMVHGSSGQPEPQSHRHLHVSTRLPSTKPWPCKKELRSSRRSGSTQDFMAFRCTLGNHKLNPSWQPQGWESPSSVQPVREHQFWALRACWGV